MVQVLIKRHANVKATDRHEKTALDLAKDDAIREALQKELQEQDKRRQAEMQAKQVSARQLFQSTDSGTGSFMLVYIDIVVALDCERTVATCDLFVQDLPCMMLDISQTMPPNVPEQQNLPGRLLRLSVVQARIAGIASADGAKETDKAEGAQAGTSATDPPGDAAAEPKSSAAHAADNGAHPDGVKHEKRNVRKRADQAGMYKASPMMSMTC